MASEELRIIHEIEWKGYLTAGRKYDIYEGEKFCEYVKDANWVYSINGGFSFCKK